MTDRLRGRSGLAAVALSLVLWAGVITLVVAAGKALSLW